MTEQMSPEQSRGILGDLIPPWIRVPLGSLCALATLIQLWSHGFKNWEWVTSIVFLGLVLFPGYPEPFRRNILILWFGNLLLHLSSGESPLALPHPQS
jgi:hypothetical protein